MSTTILLVEPDAAGRALSERVLRAAGYSAEGFASAGSARILLDEEAFALAVVDQYAGEGLPFDEVRWLRELFPRLPVVVTGTSLTATALVELLRLGVVDALPKPFTPVELRASVVRGLLRAAPERDEALDYASSMRTADLALDAGDLARAARALRRAWALRPLDADVVAYEARRAELEGRLDDAERGYRGALGLREDDAGAADAWEALGRLGARRVTP